jgi:hypothetical protein
MLRESVASHFAHNSLHLDKAVQATRCKLDQTVRQYIVSNDGDAKAATINSGAQSGLHVSNHGIVEIYAAFRHMRGDPASGSPLCLGLYLTHDECSLIGQELSRA